LQVGLIADPADSEKEKVCEKGAANITTGNIKPHDNSQDLSQWVKNELSPARFMLVIAVATALVKPD
jgi:hypothetical protein